MKAKEMKMVLVGALELGVKRDFLHVLQNQGELLLGGITLSSPGKCKVQVVDKNYHPHTYIITIEELPS